MIFPLLTSNWFHMSRCYPIETFFKGFAGYNFSLLYMISDIITESSFSSGLSRATLIGVNPVVECVELL
jgi:hypothetical protein